MDPPRVVPATPEPGEDWSADDPALADLLRLLAPPDVLKDLEGRLRALGRAAPAELDGLARLADRHRPVLRTRNAEGERVDEVEFHPAYGALARAAREHRTFTAAWHPLGDRPRGTRVASLALGYLYAQAESGYFCPACMTDGAAFVLSRHGPAGLRERYVARLTSLDPADGIEGAMYLTEKGGGSDVGGGTRTTASDARDGTWRLTGEKWFASNCVADVALALARMPSGRPGTEGLGLFLVPRRLPDGRRNAGVRIERLKEKLGVASMPTGEVLLEDAVAWLVASEGDGFKAMAEMVNLSRLYNAVASVAIARRALREGQRAGRLRVAFGKPLREHPLYLRGLVALTVDVEGALAFVLDTADAFDRFAEGDAGAERVLRAATPCAKAMTAKLAVAAASEACEFLGGAGYIEEYVTPRLLRDAQVLPIWEGTTNVQALEFLRASGKVGALAGLLARSRARLAEAGAAASPAVDEALRSVQAEAERLQGAPTDERETAALRLLARTYHAHAAALLVWRAAASRGARASAIAALYAARHLSRDRDEAERALERTTLQAGASIAYPASGAG